MKNSLLRTALAAIGFNKAGLGKTQSGARSAQSNAMNYASVNTLDPSRLGRAFASADQGYVTDQATLFELVEEQDAHIFAELAKRRRSVTGLGWQLEPPRDATQAETDRTLELEQMMRAIPGFEGAQYDLTDAIGKGFSALEIEWKTGEVWLPGGFRWVPQRMFQINRSTGSFEFLNTGIPEPLREWGWVLHQHKARSGYIEQAALFRVLAWTYAYKAYNIKDMQRFLEMYGLPLRLGKYPAGTAADQRAELLKAVRNIANDGAGIVPGNMSIDFVQAMKTGTVDDFLNATEYWEKKQSMAILGGTLTSQADGKTSTNALGAIHDKVRREIMLHDVRQIEPTLNRQLVRPVVLINGMFSDDRMPRFVYRTEETVDQGLMADVLVKAVGVGMEISVDYAHTVMQIPRAKEGDKVLSRPQAQGGAGATPPEEADPGGAPLARLPGRVALTNTGEPDPDRFGEMLALACAPFEEALQQQVAAIVAESDGFDEALEKIAELKRDPEKWAEVMAQAMAAAHLAGRADVGVSA